MCQGSPLQDIIRRAEEEIGQIAVSYGHYGAGAAHDRFYSKQQPHYRHHGICPARHPNGSTAGGTYVRLFHLSYNSCCEGPDPAGVRD